MSTRPPLSPAPVDTPLSAQVMRRLLRYLIQEGALSGAAVLSEVTMTAPALSLQETTAPLQQTVAAAPDPLGS